MGHRWISDEWLCVYIVEEVDEYILEEEQIEAMRLELGKQAIEYMDANYPYEMQQHETIARIKEQLQRSVRATESTTDHQEKREKLNTVRALYRKIMLEIVDLRRDGLKRIRLEKRYDDEVIRIMEGNLDLEEARLNKH